MLCAGPRFPAFTPPENAITKRWAVVIAGLDLYKAKGSDDPNQYDELLKGVNFEIAQYVAGERTFGDQTDVDAPIAVIPE